MSTWADFQERNGLVPDGIPGPKTLAVVLELEGQPVESPADARPWYRVACDELGTKEVPGQEHAPRVLEYLATCSKAEGGTLGDWGASRDETPWCAAFVGWCLLQAGVEPTRSAWAKSYADWGKECLPVRGAIAVLTRGEGGHVAFVESVGGDAVVLLGGNQGNAVSVRSYPRRRVISYRWPAGWVVPG